MSGGLTDRNDTPYGTWQFRFIDWFRDLGFLQKAGRRDQSGQGCGYVCGAAGHAAVRAAPFPGPSEFSEHSRPPARCF